MPTLVDLFNDYRATPDDGSGGDGAFLNIFQQSSDQDLRDFFSYRYAGHSSNSTFHLSLDCDTATCTAFIDLNKRFDPPLFDINDLNGHGLTPLARLINNQKGVVEMNKICTLAEDGANIGGKSLGGLLLNKSQLKTFNANKEEFLSNKTDLESAGARQLIATATATNQIPPPAAIASLYAQPLAGYAQQL
jgi:hypothetical protein